MVARPDHWRLIIGARSLAPSHKHPVTSTQSEGAQSEGAQSEGAQSEGAQSEGAQSEGARRLAPDRWGSIIGA
ncbi:hypothetical protein Ahu01nite_087830 [Winogradskya humida]|uniref:Uncharacterized protein n=1 Tax=Winogradskya humida TaxID=113566 RepID=A0ABQ4A4A6_9ACTN|nr:hypothetical protein Ahu01nite_087830 [Actinoplanes humidus]